VPLSVAADRWPSRVVVLAASCRTGSTLLAAALARTGAMGRRAHELFHEEALRRLSNLEMLQARPSLRQILEARSPGQAMPRSAYSTEEIVKMLDRIGRRETGAQGVLSLKVMWGDYAGVLLARGLDFNYWGAPITWLRIRRLDHERQAVSWSRAAQTGQWTSAGSARSIPTFRPEQIAHYLAMARKWDEGWDNHFQALGIQPFTIHYEDLSDAYEATIRALYDHLGLADHAVPPAPLRRQSDTLNENWLRQFKAWQASWPHASVVSSDGTRP
jgi:LPS sulfotransferase NodH